MNVLYVSNGLPPDHRSGTEIHTLSLARSMGKGHRVGVFYPHHDQPAGLNRSVDGSFRRFAWSRGEPSNSSRPFHVPGISPLDGECEESLQDAFRTTLDEMRPDIVHFQHTANLSPHLLETARATGAPVVLALHDYWYRCPRFQLLRKDTGLTLCDGPESDGSNCYRCITAEQGANYVSATQAQAWLRPALQWIGTRAARMALSEEQFASRTQMYERLIHIPDLLLTPSRSARDQLVETGVSSERIKVSYNGYDRSRFNHFERSTRPHETVVGYAGALRENKGVHVLIRAFQKLDRNDVRMHVFGGSGVPEGSAYEHRLHREADGSDHIRFFGAYEDVTTPYAHMDVLVIPSLWHETGGPLVLLEALLTGTPVLATECGSMSEIAGKADWIRYVERGSTASLHREMKQAIQNLDRMRRAMEGASSRVRSIGSQQQELEALYADLCDS